MDMKTRPDVMDLIHLADPCQSVSVRLLSTTASMERAGARYYDAPIVIASDFVNGSVRLGFDSVEGAEQGVDPGELFTAGRPRGGPTAYLRFIAEDPYVVEVHDGPSTQIVVSVPLDMREERTAEVRQCLARVRGALGE
ncbi:DUF5959 family protein [Streptomyces sp. NPDC097617]|uniref:DUF5959 family protein n=1 Tax=Streptomyces sp. NPDC097617 TaxID=3366091 RepID=UPI00380DA05E